MKNTVILICFSLYCFNAEAQYQEKSIIVNTSSLTVHDHSGSIIDTIGDAGVYAQYSCLDYSKGDYGCNYVNQGLYGEAPLNGYYRNRGFTIFSFYSKSLTIYGINDCDDETPISYTNPKMDYSFEATIYTHVQLDNGLFQFLYEFNGYGNNITITDTCN